MLHATAGNAPRHSLSTTGNRTYAVQLDNNSSNLDVNAYIARYRYHV